MTEPDALRGQLESEVPPAEVEEVMQLAERLRSERPVPRARFRSELRARLLRSGELAGRRPARLRLTIGAYLASGVALLGVAALGVAGVGPFAHDDDADAAGGSPYISSTR